MEILALCSAKSFWSICFSLFCSTVGRSCQNLAKTRSSHRTCSLRKSVLRYFAKFTGKHMCQSFYFNKVADQACNFIKIQILAQVFSCEFSKISKNTSFTEYVWVTASIKQPKTRIYLLSFSIFRWHVIVQTHRNKKLNILIITCQSKEKNTN